MNSGSKQKWLETGYKLFGEYGPGGLNIKLLSEKAGLPRTNFYYHFADKDDLVEQLLVMHTQIIDVFHDELEKQFNVFIPDLYRFCSLHKEGFMFHRQLFLNRNDPRFNIVYIRGISTGSPIIIPKLKDYYRLDVPYSVAESLWTTVTDTWYSRLDFDKFETEYLCELTEDIMKTILDFARKKLFVNSAK